jgi:hypothetical protein
MMGNKTYIDMGRGLAAYLEKLCPDATTPVLTPPRSELDRKMDKYDLAKTMEYENLGTPEFPIWGKRSAMGLEGLYYTSPGGAPFWPNTPSVPPSPMYATYGMIQRHMYAVSGFTDTAEAPAPPRETPYDKLKMKIARLADVEAVKVEAPVIKRPSPDYIHTLTGWRGWDVSDHGYLESVGTESTWGPKRAIKAICSGNSSHEAPQMACNCGYWSFKSHENLVKAISGYASTVKVIGKVEIWGRVIECENGYRSEFAYPSELWLLDEGIESLGHIYGVPIRK